SETELTKIVLRCKTGAATEQEWNNLLRAVHPRLILALEVLCGRDDALGADFAQEAMVKSIESIRSFRGTSYPEFRSWCITIARRIASDHYRRTSQKKLSILDPAEIQALREAAANEGSVAGALSADATRAAAVIEKLGNPCRQLLTLHYLHGLDYADIAAITGKKYDAVRVAILRCRHEARKLFEEK